MEQEFEDFENASGMGKTELLRRVYFQGLQSAPGDLSLDREMVKLVLDHAKRVIAHPSRPQLNKLESFFDYPQGDLALEETLEENPTLSAEQEVFVERSVEKNFSCVAIMDCSASMSGEKHLLASVAVAVLLLEIAAKDTGLVVFSSKATSIKKLQAEENSEATLLKFLKHKPRGFTNINVGLEEALKQMRTQGGQKRRVGLIATDGRSTEGGDPVEAANQFDFLVVLHLHGPGSSLDASQEIAQAGKGICLEVENFEQLPYRIYDAVKLLARL